MGSCHRVRDFFITYSPHIKSKYRLFFSFVSKLLIFIRYMVVVKLYYRLIVVVLINISKERNNSTIQTAELVLNSRDNNNLRPFIL